MLGYGCVLAMRHLILRKYIIMHINWTRDFVAYGLLIAQMVIALWGISTMVFQMLITIMILVVFKKEVVSLIKIIRRIKNQI